MLEAATWLVGIKATAASFLVGGKDAVEPGLTLSAEYSGTLQGENIIDQDDFCFGRRSDIKLTNFEFFSSSCNAPKSTSSVNSV
jgi:hypothetical protein